MKAIQIEVMLQSIGAEGQGIPGMATAGMENAV
jgi:hypothetical protein